MENSGRPGVMSDTDLVAACRAGSEQAWRLLVERYARLVHSIPVRHGLTPSEVEDVGQEVFLALAQQLDSIEDPSRLPGWLATTARRISWQALRRRDREAPDGQSDLSEQEVATGIPVGHGVIPSIGEIFAGWERQAVLDAGLAALGERCKRLLHAIFLDPDEPSYERISAEFGIPKGSIGPTRNRCLAQLRRILEGLGYDVVR